MIQTEFMAVERKSGFEAQCVSGPKSYRGGALAHQEVPDNGTLVPIHEQFIAQWFARVAGAGDQHARPGDLNDADGVANGFRQPARFNHPGHQVPGRGSLESDHGDLKGTVYQFDPLETLQMRLEMIPVL